VKVVVVVVANMLEKKTLDHANTSASNFKVWGDINRRKKRRDLFYSIYTRINFLILLKI